MIQISFRDDEINENNKELINNMAKKKFLSKTVEEEPTIMRCDPLFAPHELMICTDDKIESTKKLTFTQTKCISGNKREIHQITPPYPYGNRKVKKRRVGQSNQIYFRYYEGKKGHYDG